VCKLAIAERKSLGAGYLKLDIGKRRRSFFGKLYHFVRDVYADNPAARRLFSHQPSRPSGPAANV
jgi:hypothetical protein